MKDLGINSNQVVRIQPDEIMGIAVYNDIVFINCNKKQSIVIRAEHYDPLIIRVDENTKYKEHDIITLS